MQIRKLIPIGKNLFIYREKGLFLGEPKTFKRDVRGNIIYTPLSSMSVLHQ